MPALDDVLDVIDQARKDCRAVNRESSYKPTDEDTLWAEGVVASVRYGGTIVYPQSRLTYRVNHDVKVLELLNDEILIVDWKRNTSAKH